MIRILSRIFSILMLSTVYSSSLYCQQPASSSAIIGRLEKEIPMLIARDQVPGLTAALIRDGRIVWQRDYGVINQQTGKPVTRATIWEAASLTKVVTAYTFLKLVDQGRMNLDTPLTSYTGNAYDAGTDKRIYKITARHVLSHTSGFPNWRSGDSGLLPINFDPGTKWSYSGEGFVYLSKVMEKVTGKSFEELMKTMVFVPLGMSHSSLTWQPAFDSLKIYRHNWLGKMSFRSEDKDANAAASLHTTAEDYAKFMIAVMNGTGLQKKTAAAMLSVQFEANEKTPEVAWGLGVGLETNPNAKYFWHWGDQGDSKCFMIGDPVTKNGFVYFTNGANGLSIAPELLEAAGTGKHRSLQMLNYARHQPAAANLFNNLVNKGADTALRIYREARERDKSKSVSQEIINTIGYQLARMNRIQDAIAVWKQNTIDFPGESNVWDSLAEGYMINGEDQLAITNYEKAIALDPANTNAINMLKKLKAKP